MDADLQNFLQNYQAIILSPDGHAHAHTFIQDEEVMHTELLKPLDYEDTSDSEALPTTTSSSSSCSNSNNDKCEKCYKLIELDATIHIFSNQIYCENCYNPINAPQITLLKSSIIKLPTQSQKTKKVRNSSKEVPSNMISTTAKVGTIATNETIETIEE